MLEKYARKPKGYPRNRPVSTKLTPQEYKEFREHVQSFGLTISEALRLLIAEELNDWKPKKAPIEAKKETLVDQGKPKETKVTSSASTRKYLSQFKVDGKFPCPICKKWIHNKKFSTMHARKHEGLSSMEFLRKYEQEALEMVRNKTVD